VTQHSTTNSSPAEMLMKRKPRKMLVSDLLHPDLFRASKTKFHKHIPCGKFETGDSVFARNYQGPDKWIYAIVQKKMGPVNYLACSIVMLTN
jgi:hypothetical protein